MLSYIMSVFIAPTRNYATYCSSVETNFTNLMQWNCLPYTEACCTYIVSKCLNYMYNEIFTICCVTRISCLAFSNADPIFNDTHVES